MRHESIPQLDRGIKNLVLALNARGIPTSGSCEGHVDHGSPAPWIKVRLAGKTMQRGGRIRRRSNANNEQERISRYLRLFYRNRRVRSDARIVIDKVHAGFRIHNGGNAYVSWRNLVNRNATRIRRGQKARAYISGGKVYRSARISRFRREMRAFAAFLNQQSRERNLDRPADRQLS